MLILRGYHRDDDDGTRAQMLERGRCGGMVVMSGYVISDGEMEDVGSEGDG